PRPQFVIGCEVLSNESTKPAHLRWHFTTKHALLKDKPVDFRKFKDLKQRKSTIRISSAVKVVNSIKARPINSHMFSVLCNEMGSEHVQLLLHTERGRVLTRLFELHSEEQMFLHDQHSPLASLFDDPVWLVKLVYRCSHSNSWYKPVPHASTHKPPRRTAVRD
ncbi:ZMYM6 protein, partial [Atractosteus spatula]|nr:ZMYM6 protein [Atractosteus spatula]